jgi:hypothetical protein
VPLPSDSAEGAGRARNRKPAATLALAPALIACTLLALWMVWPAFEPGRIVNLDAPRHLLRAEVMMRQFLPSGHVDGWSPWWYLGAQLFLFQSYGYFFAIGASAIALAPWAGLGSVFKVWYVAPMVAMPVLTARLALGLGVAPVGAAAAALASLAFSTPLGYGMKGLFGIGLLLQAAGVAGFALAWPGFLAALRDAGRGPWTAILLLAGVLLVHFISGAFALAAGGIAAAWLAWRGREFAPLGRYALVAVLVLLLAAHALMPSLELHHLSGSGVGWGSERDRLERFFLGTLFGARPLALAALAAALWSLRRGSPALSATALVYFVTAVLGGSDQQPWEPSFLADPLRMYVRPRVLPYAALLQAVFVGVALEAVIRAARRLGASRFRWDLVAAVAAFALLVGVAVPEAVRLRREVRTESQLKKRDRRVYLDLAAWLRRNVRRPAVIAVPRTLFPPPVLGARSAVSLLNLDTGLYSLGGDQAELTRAVRGRDRIDLEDADRVGGELAGQLRRAGVSYLVVRKADVRARLEGRPEFEKVYEDEGVELRRRSSRRRRTDEKIGVAVYRVEGGGQWLHGRGVEVISMRHQPERSVWQVRVEGRSLQREVVAAINWHPNWKAVVDGRPTPTRRSTSGRVAFDVPTGSARVVLEFVRSVREKAWNALSAATLAMVLFLQARHLVGRRRL